MTSVPLFVAPIGRMVFARFGGAPPDAPELHRIANAWLSSFAAPPYAERLVAWERRHPLRLGIARREELEELDGLWTTREAGAEELAAYRAATHVVLVLGHADAGGDGWLGVEACARAIARAWGGVIVDRFTFRFRPLDEACEPLADPEPAAVCGTLSIPTAPNRWVFTTHGLGNLGLPEVWFDEVRGPHVAAAVPVIQALRDVVARGAAAHVRAHGLDGFALGELAVPGFGRVRLADERHPLLGDTGLRALPARGPAVALGRVLARRRALVALEVV